MKKNNQIAVDGDLEVIEDRVGGMIWAYTLRKSGNDVASFPQAAAASHAMKTMAKPDEKPSNADGDQTPLGLERATVVYVEMQSSSDRRASSEDEGDDGDHEIGAFA